MKDPAFLFYSKDFYEGTRLMLPEERACYIDLLIYQHQHGFIPDNLKRVMLYCSGIDEATLEATLEAKFVKTEKGWYNEKLSKVVEDRKEFSSKQSDNGIIGQFFKKAKSKLETNKYFELKKFIYDNDNKQLLIDTIKESNFNYEYSLEAMLQAMLKHLENENENENENKDLSVNTVNTINGENSKKENSKIESASKEVAREKAIKYIKELPEHKIKILKEKLEINEPMMYQKRNNTEWRSLAVDVSDAFLDDINTPIMARNFDNELEYFKAVKMFLRTIIPAEMHLDYKTIGEFRKHFTHKMKPINK